MPLTRYKVLFANPSRHVQLITGSANPALARALLASGRFIEVSVDHTPFPDGELHPVIGPIAVRTEVVVLQSTRTPEQWVELLLLLDAARRAGAARIRAWIPYLGYARQDRLTIQGEPLSLEVMARTIGSRCDEVAVVEIHNPATLAMFGVPASNVTCHQAIADHLRAIGTDQVLAPDAGSRDRAAAVAALLGIPHDHLEKTRLDGERVEMVPKDLNVTGKRVAIVDDMIATGGTIIEAAKQLRDQGAASVDALCIHGVFAGSRFATRPEPLDAVHASDTLPGPYTTFSVAQALVEAAEDR